MQHTTNLNLNLPEYNEAADIQVINGNMNTIDTAITATKSDLGIVEDGNTATHSITAGQYVIWKGNLYTASSAIATGTTLSTSNLTAVSNGGLNSLNEQIATVNSKKITQTLLGYGASNAYFATSSINDYDLIVVALVDQTYAAIHGSTIVPKSTYTQSSAVSAIGVTAYNNGRIYGYANYVSDTTSNAQVSAGYAVYLYGIRWN